MKVKILFIWMASVLSNTSSCLQKAIPLVFLLLFLQTAVFAESEAAAQQDPRPRANTRNEAGGTNADFLFNRPAGFFGFSLGIFSPRADSDLFDMVMRELTIKKSDFRALNFGLDGGFRLYDTVDLVFSLDTSKREINSEFRDWVDEQGVPITQTTSFSQTQLTAGIRYLLMPAGRQIGQYAWLPSRIVPFIDGGGGILWYTFRQNGDFVDVSTLEIFRARFESSGSAPTVYLGVGADIHILRSAYLTVKLRYSWARDELERDFVGFDPIDLNGLRLSAGVNWQF